MATNIDRIGSIYEAVPGANISDCLNDLRTLMESLKDGESVTMIHNDKHYTVTLKIKSK